MRDAWESFVARLNAGREWFLGLDTPAKVGVGVGALVVAGGLGLGAAALFGGDGEPPATTAPLAVVTTTTTSSTTTSTTTTSTTTTTVPSAPGSVLNGLPADDPELLDRRALAVKIDNHPRARPQSGLSQADLIYELLVEGGLSRFIAIFHDNDSEYVGPIRSGRPTDPTLIKPTRAVMVYSGAQPWVQSIIVNAGVPLIGEGDGTFRINTRSAPHNLYGDTTQLREVAVARGYDVIVPPPFFELGAWVGTEPAAQISTPWDAANRVTWLWDGTAYQRFTNELPHTEIDVEGNETQVSTDVLVVLAASRYTARPPGDGTAVPALETEGGGAAYVFANGTVIEGTWARRSIDDAFELTDAAGNPIVVPPGRPWVAVFPDSQTVSWLAEPAP